MNFEEKELCQECLIGCISEFNLSKRDLQKLRNALKLIKLQKMEVSFYFTSEKHTKPYIKTSTCKFLITLDNSICITP